MTVATPAQPDSTSQAPTAWAAAVDGQLSVFARLSGPFAPHAQSTPNMTVRLDAGVIPAWLSKPTEVAAQSTGTISAPVANSRKDIVYVDAKTGAVGVATGTSGASPSDPAIAAGKVAVARVTLTSATTAITNSMIDDLRASQFLGLGTAAALDLDTDAALAANSDSRIATQKATKGYVDAAVAAAASASDIQALQQDVCQLYLNSAITSAGAAGAFANGGFDAFNSDTIGSNSTNQTYDGTNKLYYNGSSAPTTSYANAGGTGDRTASITVTYGGTWNASWLPSSALVDGATSNVAIPNDASANDIGDYVRFDFGAGAAKYFTEFKEYYSSASSDSDTWKWQGSNDASTWSDMTGADTWGGGTSIARTVTGNYGPWRYVQKICVSGNNSGSYFLNEVDFKIGTTAGVIPNMTLASNALATLAAVSTVMAEVLYKDIDASTLNTDFTLEVTANGGTNWTTATLSDTGATVTASGYKVLWASTSGLTSGTSVKYRLKTLNNKSQQVKGVALMAK